MTTYLDLLHEVEAYRKAFGGARMRYLARLTRIWAIENDPRSRVPADRLNYARGKVNEEREAYLAHPDAAWF